MTTNELLDTGQRHRADKPPVDEPELSVSLLAEDLYVVLSPTMTLGFVERVGTVFVALSGPDLARAVEVRQSLSWNVAIDAVRDSYRNT